MNKNFAKKINSIFLLIILFVVGYSYNLFIFKTPKMAITPHIPNDEVSMMLANAQIGVIRTSMVFIIVFTVIGTISSMVLLRNLFSRKKEGGK